MPNVLEYGIRFRRTKYSGDVLEGVGGREAPSLVEVRILLTSLHSSLTRYLAVQNCLQPSVLRTYLLTGYLSFRETPPCLRPAPTPRLIFTTKITAKIPGFRPCGEHAHVLGYRIRARLSRRDWECVSSGVGGRFAPSNQGTHLFCTTSWLSNTLSVRSEPSSSLYPLLPLRLIFAIQNDAENLRFRTCGERSRPPRVWNTGWKME